MEPLSKLADTGSVSHVVVFVADSLRFDHLPEAVRQRGVTCRTISPSTFTGSSVPSMMTGTYPSSHRVWDFDDVVPKPPVLFEGPNRGLTTQNVWQNSPPERRPPLRTLRLRKETTLEDVADAPTSLVVVHDRGAHGPYNFLNSKWDDSPEFFADLGDDHAELRRLYEAGADHAGERFLDLVDAAADRGELTNTLFVFTSDHGELLGEPERGGVFGHGSPMGPELVEVPTTFVGAGLPAGEQPDALLSGTDLAPTLLGAQERAVPGHVEGIDAWRNPIPEDRVARSEIWARGKVAYGASSAWQEDGGLVRHLGSRLNRMAFGIHRNLVVGAQVPATRSTSPRRMLGLLRSFGRKEIAYGQPDSAALRPHIRTEFEVGDAEYGVPGPEKEQLEALGYVQ